MTREEFKALNRGDLIKHASDQRVFVVTANYGHQVVAVASVVMTNPPEWEKIENKDHTHKERVL